MTDYIGGFSFSVYRDIKWSIELNKNYDELREFIKLAQHPEKLGGHIHLSRRGYNLLVVDDLFITPVKLYFNNDWVRFFEFLQQNSEIKQNRVKLLDYELLRFPKWNEEEYKKYKKEYYEDRKEVA
jgi:hypothetical protein